MLPPSQSGNAQSWRQRVTHGDALHLLDQSLTKHEIAVVQREINNLQKISQKRTVQSCVGHCCAPNRLGLPHVLEHAALVEKIVRMTINETAEHIRQSLDIDVAQYFYVYETLVDNVKSLHINSLPVVKVVVTHTTKMLTICVKEM